MSQTVIVYYRDACHLCEDMLEALSLFQSIWQGEAFEITLIDIDADEHAAHKEKYHTQVPVLSLNHQVICHYYFDQQGLTEALNKIPDGTS